jgi:hypothetical protein
MKRITLTIDDEVLERARIYAAEQKTSLSKIVGEHLKEIARIEPDLSSTRKQLMKLMHESSGRLGPDWTWNREDAYEGRVFP